MRELIGLQAATLAARSRTGDTRIGTQGKPADIGPGGQQVRAYLDRETIDRARQLGKGNFSLGLRLAVKQSTIICTGNKPANQGE